MAIIKLNKGTTVPVVLTITGLVRDVPANNPRYGPQHKLVGHTPTDPDACIFLAPDTAVRQLARVGLTLDTAIGHTVAITRPADYIDFASPNGAAPLPAPAPAPTDADGLTDANIALMKKLSGLHRRCLRFVLEHEVPMLDDKKVGESPESISALTAQLFIAATDAGLGR